MSWKYWPVLIVDDEPDVLAVSKLAVKNLKFFGLPVKPYTFESKRAAIDYFNEEKWKYGSFIALALIDVMMETDEAGLELCELIRADMKNYSTQLYIRTGQSAQKNEYDVVEKYRVSGYISKAEATQERVQSIIKTGLHRYFTTTVSYAHMKLIGMMLQASTSRDSLRKALQGLMETLNAEENDSMTPDWCFIFGNEAIGGGIYKDPELALKKRDELNGLQAVMETSNGGLLFESDNAQMIRVPHESGDREKDFYQLLGHKLFYSYEGLAGRETTEFVSDLYKIYQQMWLNTGNR